MKLIIEIDEEDYEFIKEFEEGNYYITQNLYKAVYEGKPMEESRKIQCKNCGKQEQTEKGE